MAEPVLMPQVGQDIKTARVVDWLKKENQEVKKGEVIAVVESDKATFDVEAYTSGVLLKILHAEGQEVEVLTPIAYIGRPGEQIEDARQRTEDRGQTTEVISSESAIRHPQSAMENRIAISPSARRFQDVVKEICGIVDGPVSVEALAETAEAMVPEAQALARIAPNVVVKIPMTVEGLKAVPPLH